MVGPLVLVLLIALTGSVQAATATKTVRYRGYSLRVPAAWPVFRLTPGSTTCVRFNRHAVYLGTPSTDQLCPAHAVGRTESILVSPASRQAGPRSALATPAIALDGQLEGAATQRSAGHGLIVTATWNGDPAVVRRALRVPALMPAPAVKRTSADASAADALAGAGARPASPDATARAATSGTTFTGLGFDACSTPSTSTMSKWLSSPYRALGVYIGGANEACSQSNLTTSWLSTEWASGWHVIPIYVSRQAPGNSCGCQPMTPSRAGSQGRAAALDAIAHAQALGISPGNPIYDDMEGYSPGGSTTAAVLKFLSAWTTQLHADGYSSGVYSSGTSGIADLAARYGTTYTEPDDIWVAHWNGQKTTTDVYLPSDTWLNHRRLHQYSGGINERYGGAVLNIDGDYIDAATAYGPGTPVTVPQAPAPTVRVNPSATGLVSLYASWQGASGIASWNALGGTNPNALQIIGSSTSRGTVTTIAEHSAFPYYAVQAIAADGSVIGASPAVATRPHVVLYGRSVFAPARGLIGVPAGCLTGATCKIALTVTAGRTRIATSNAERLRASGGLLYFTLSATGRSLLNAARQRRLPIRVTARDVMSGRSASARMSLVPYTTGGGGPKRSAQQGSTLRFIGLRDFVFRNASGGLLVGCVGAIACQASATITAGHQIVATSTAQLIGANSVGYLSYRLTAFGHQLMAKARDNQLGVSVTLSALSPGAVGSFTATAHLALSTYR